MALAAPSINKMFEDVSPSERPAKFLEFTSALDACLEKGLRQKMQGISSFEKGVGIVKSDAGRMDEILEKTVSAEQLSAVRSALATADVAKEWTLTNPLSVVPFGAQGLVPYDLSPVLQMIVPRELKIRNTVPRIKGIGTALNFRSITGVSNSASGSVANLSTFFDASSSTQTVGGIAWNRPPAISYAAASQTVVYQTEGVSDSVSMTAEYAGQGYTSLRSLSATSTLWATLLGNERNFLGGVSTALDVSGASGTIVADTTITASGLPGAAVTAAYATFSSAATIAGLSGESKAITLTQSVTTSANEGVKFSVIAGVPAGTVAINVYLNYSSTYYKGTTTFTNVGAYGVGAAPAKYAVVSALPSTSADNGSYSANAYDGFISEFTGANTGYTKAINAALSTTSPTTEFQAAFSSLYTSIAADPDVIWTTPSIRQATAAALQAAGASSNTGFRINYDGGGEGVAVGSFITGIVNEVTGKTVSLETHRYMPAGVAVIHSFEVPFPDSGVSNTVEYHAPADMVMLEWPVTDLNYSMSSYSYGALAFRAPAFSGCLTSINN